MVMILLCIYPQTTGLLLSALGNLSAMADFGDSRDDAESLLQDLKELAEKSVVISLLKDCFFNKLPRNFASMEFQPISILLIKLMIYVYCTLL